MSLHPSNADLVMIDISDASFCSVLPTTVKSCIFGWAFIKVNMKNSSNAYIISQ